MTSHFLEILLFLSYLLLPLAAWLVYAIYKLVRRGKEPEGEGTESEA